MMPGGMFGGPWVGGGFGIFGMILMLIFWVLIIAGIVLVVKRLVEQGRSGGASASSGESALDILKKRYARGEIGTEEFEAKKRDLL
jgi:putative membrane protein